MASTPQPAPEKKTDVNVGIGLRLKTFFNTLGISMAEFERRSNLSNGQSGKVFTAKLGITVEKLSGVFAAYPELNAEWLLLGRGQMLHADGQQSFEPAEWEDPVHALADLVKEHIAEAYTQKQFMAYLVAVRKESAELRKLNTDLQKELVLLARDRRNPQS